MQKWHEPWIEQDPRTKNWNVRWRELGPDGEMHKRSILAANYVDAGIRRKKKREEMLAISTMTVNPHADLAPLIELYIRRRIEVRKLRPGSILLKRRAYKRYLQFTKTIGEINKESLVDYRDNLYSQYDNGVTVGTHFREIKAFVRWLYKEEKIEKDPFVQIEMPRQESTPHFITDDEIIAIEKVSSHKFLKIFRTAYLTGMRAGELISARWEQVSWVWEFNPETKKNEQRAFITLEAKLTKTRHSRTIPLRREIVELIGRQKTDLIFGYSCHQYLHDEWVKTKERAGITDRIRFHDLRHTFCRIYLQGGGTISDMMSITGHQSLAMVQVYAHYETRWKSARMDAINLPSSFTGQIQGTDAGLSVIPTDHRGPTETNGLDGKDDLSTENDGAVG